MNQSDARPSPPGMATGWKGQSDEWARVSIESGDFGAYCEGITHDWLRTLMMLIFGLVPVFFLLDVAMMPAELLPRFAMYRGVSALIGLGQFFMVIRTEPGRWSYLHGYLASLQVGAMIVLMTADLGGFSSSYYAGLNLVMIGVNLLIPWGARHTAANTLMVFFLYAGFNFPSYQSGDTSFLINNLYFMSGTIIIVIAINHLRFQLLKREFSLLVLVEAARGAIQMEKEIVDERNKSIKSLLDVSGQGFLSFDTDFRVSQEYSRACESIFNGPIAGTQIDELLFVDDAARENFRTGLGLVFEGKTNPEVIFDLLDTNLVIADKTVKAEYKAVDERRVMAALTDITRETLLLESSRRENEKWNLLRKVIGNRQAFRSFCREARAVFAELSTAIKAGKSESLLRNLHTLKANAGFLGFNRTQSAAHLLEDFLADRIILGEEIAAGKEIRGLMYAFEEEIASVHDSLGPEWSSDVDMIELPEKDYLKILKHIRLKCPDAELTDMMENQRRKPLSVLLAGLPQMAADLGARMGKRLSPLVMTGGAIRVVPEEFEELIGSFTHVIRNMVDHGIELPGEREAGGKSPAGTLAVNVRESADEIRFTFSDDGKGISRAEVAARAIEMGLLGKEEAPSTSKLLQFIFRDQFTTHVNASEISGRGVGLPAVRVAVRKMGGRISVHTTAKTGTAITITVPRRLSIYQEKHT